MENNILFSIGGHYRRFFWNFEKFPKISKGGTLGIFFVRIFKVQFEGLKMLKRPKLTQCYPFTVVIGEGGGPPPQFFLNAFLDELRIQKKNWTVLTLMEISYFFLNPPLNGIQINARHSWQCSWTVTNRVHVCAPPHTVRAAAAHNMHAARNTIFGTEILERDRSLETFDVIGY